MTDIAAAIGIVQLEKASDMQRRREEIAASRIERV
jgi:dTDP-4-amino-4,6-dideoxygalactose transaminase